MKISNIYVEPKFGTKDKYVADVAEYINKRIMEAIGTTAFTEKDKENIIQHFQRELDSCTPEIQDKLGLWDIPVEYSNLSEITGAESGVVEYSNLSEITVDESVVIEYNNGIIICNWGLADIEGIPRFSPPFGLMGLKETLTAEYLGDCDDIYEAVKGKGIIYYENKGVESLRKTRGQKYHIFGNGKLKATVYTPDGWD
jgi:hypothetical protein